MGQKTKSISVVGMLMTSTRILIPVLLTEKEDALQLNEILQRRTVEKKAPNVPYLKWWDQLDLNYNKESWSRKLRGRRRYRNDQREGTFAQGETTSLRGADAQRVEMRPSKTST